MGCLRRNGFEVLYRVHPSPDNYFGRKTRHYLLKEGKTAHMGAALFYMLDVLRSTLLFSGRRGTVKVFTRYLMGTAYLPESAYEAAYRCFAFALPTSGLMFLLDITPEVARRRLNARRDRNEMFETTEQLGKVRARVLGLAKKYGWTIIDADKNEVEVHNQITRRMVERTGLKLH